MLQVVALLGVGVLLARLRTLPDGTSRALDAVIINASLPALIIAAVPDLDLRPSTAIPVAVAWGAVVVGAVLVLLLGRVFRWQRRTVGTLLLVVPLGNTSFFGVPAVEALLGADQVPYALVYDQLGSFLALATYGSVVAARYGGGDGRGSVLRRVATFPPFVALLVALVLRVAGVPPLVDAVAERLGSTVTPLAMLAVGMRLTLPTGVQRLGATVLGLGVRMGALPAIAYAATVALGVAAGPAWRTSILEAAMPPMVSAAVVASDADLDGDLAAALVGGGILLALVTLPLWAAFTG